MQPDIKKFNPGEWVGEWEKPTQKVVGLQVKEYPNMEFKSVKVPFKWSAFKK